MTNPPISESNCSEQFSHLIKFHVIHQLTQSFPFLFYLVWRLHLMYVVLSAIIVNLFGFYFASRVHFIENSSILIQRELISLIGKEDVEALMQMKEASIELWFMSELLNERFAYTLLVSITSELTIFVIDIYWLYSRVVNGILNFYFIRKKQSKLLFGRSLNIFYSLLASFVLCLHPLISIIGTFYSCSSASNEFRNISSVLHQLSNHSSNSECNAVFLKQLESFSMQLMTTKLEFTAKHFFDISSATLRGVK